MAGKILCLILFACALQLHAVIEVSVGTAPEKFIVDQIGGSKIKVNCIVPQGKNVHDFSVTPETVRNVAKSQVFFHTGLLFEQKITEILLNGKVRIVNLSRYITRIPEVHPHHNKSEHPSGDVHTWFSYINLKSMAYETEKVLSELDGANAAFYQRNCIEFCRKIDEARETAEKKLQKYAGRTFLTYHAAFGYFALEFDLKQLSFEFNGRELTPGNLVALTRYVSEYKIKRIFIQSTVSENVRRAIRNAVKAQLVVVDPANYNILQTLNCFSGELEASFE